jgi:hypothetical protein
MEKLITGGMVNTVIKLLTAVTSKHQKTLEFAVILPYYSN